MKMHGSVSVFFLKCGISGQKLPFPIMDFTLAQYMTFPLQAEGLLVEGGVLD